MKPAYTLFLKTGTFCNAGCISCPAGRKFPEEKESGRLMTVDMVEQILEHTLKFGNIISVVHHFYNEPTLNPQIAAMIRACHKRGIHCLMSTNGSYYDKLLPVLEEGLTNLIFSVSGWTQEIHQRSHKNTDIEYIKDAMKKASVFIHTHRDFKGNRMFIRTGWHDYPYNVHERPLMKKYSEDLGFTFTSYQTSLLPLERAQARMLQAMADPLSAEDVGERDLRTKLIVAAKLCAERKHWPCIYQQRMLVIDSNGILHNCPAKAHDNKPRNFFDTDLEEFNQHRLTEEEDCQKCRSHGFHLYGSQQYRTPVTLKNNLLKKAEAFWRNNNLGGIFPGITAKLVQWTYERPQKEDIDI